MIKRRELIRIAESKGVPKSTIEKDWILGHSLDAIMNIENHTVDTVQMPMNRSIPGFLIPPEDRSQVQMFVTRLFNTRIKDMTYYQLLNRIHPMPT